MCVFSMFNQAIDPAVLNVFTTIYKMVDEPVIPTLQYLYFKSLYTIHKVLECNTRTYP